MKRPILRTPDARFENLPGFDFELHYADPNRSVLASPPRGVHR